MNVLILSIFLACASAQYWPAYSGYPYAGYYGRYYGLPGPVASQYHSQDALGQASYGYAYPGQAATNYRDAAGNQIGSYAYINPEGKEVRVSYTADSNGFRVISNDLPVAPAAGPVFTGQAPQPVQDTAEVVAAKAEFFKAFKAAGGAAPERKKRQVFAALPTKQFVDDLHYQSVDLNQDGQPDVPVYPAVQPLPYAYPSYVAAPAVKYVAAPAVQYAAAPAFQYVAAPVAAPLVAKQTVKTLTLEADKDAKTPSATTLLETKEKDVEVITPLAYNYGPAIYPAAYPVAYPTYQQYVPAAAAAAPVTVESSRKKRQVVAVLPTGQFYNDLAYKSVDLNQDGQPDKAVVPAPLAYSYGYNYGYPSLFNSRYALPYTTGYYY